MMLGNKKINLKSIDTIAYLLIIIFIIVFIFLGFGRHDALKSFQNDIGVYSQILWNTLHGNFFEASGAVVSITLQPDGTTLENFNYLSAHFSPILLLLAPLYAIWSDPKLLIIIQAIAVGLGALPIYWLAREKIKNKFGGIVFLVSYLLYPILHNALLYDFHEVTLAVPIVTFALWFWYKKKTGWMFLFLALLLLVQEHTSLIIFMFGLYLAFFQKRWKFGFTLSGVAIAYFFVIMLVIIPSFSSTGEPSLITAASSETLTRYQWLGSGVGEIFDTIIHRPLWVLQNMLDIKRIDFLATLLLPLIGLSVFSGLFLLTVPILAIYFLSQFSLTYSVYFYHSAILAGIIFFAAIFAFSRLIRDSKRQRIFLLLILCSSIIISYLYSVTPLSARYSWRDYQPSANARLLPEIKALIPDDASISIQHNIGPHFANRRMLFHFPFMTGKSDYIIADAFNPYADNPKSFFVFGDSVEIEPQSWANSLGIIFEKEEFGIVYYKDGWYVFKRGASRELIDEAKADFTQRLEQLWPYLH